MQNIIIGRYDADPEAQGVIKPEDGSWQLVIDKEGYPHLYVRVPIEGQGEGLFCLEDMLPEKLTTKDLMLGAFTGVLSGTEAEEANQEFLKDREQRQIPNPR